MKKIFAVVGTLATIALPTLALAQTNDSLFSYLLVGVNTLFKFSGIIGIVLIVFGMIKFIAARLKKNKKMEALGLTASAVGIIILVATFAFYIASSFTHTGTI